MARAYASRIIPAPVEAVWALVRDFNALPEWHPAIVDSVIEEGLDADVVGCVRAFHLGDGTLVRERLLELDDSRYAFAYNFETPAFPVENYEARFTLIPLTTGEETLAIWEASFDEAPEEAGKYVDVVSNGVFATGLAALAEKVAGIPSPQGARWQGLRPAKVYCASRINAPLATAWAAVRDFAGMVDWHPDIHRMNMLDGARSDKVGGVRDFLFGEGQLHEQLTYLSDRDTAFRYKINLSPMPWLNYHAGLRLYRVTADDTTLAVWTADWVATPQDDLALIPTVHENVFQLAFDTLNARFDNAA
ncbi:SRPBCC family protein [Ancylobacter pratisalsi]|uniref:SRPBCC family protein n=1 Tax=Ancylobacter pratisalsi TaxID=1745854 RepID=A0A6P1YV41_9HYPH|nr:SRPBCC family protein [Ancylobacter pratisalsi]QIB35983.1 SRPBCC family protein [Ancylobacter pratisalsi]